jgi:acetyl esterase/lipase
VIKSLQDSTRCLQFIRYHAEQLNIDPSNVILMIEDPSGEDSLGFALRHFGL